MERREAAARQLRDLVGFVERGKLAEAGSGADIRAEADAHRAARIDGLEQAEQPAAEEQIRGRAVRQGRTRLMAGTKVGLAEVDAMTEHGAPADQPGMCI